MDYKTLLTVHTTHEPIANLAPVAALARHFDAHMEVVILSALLPLPTMIVAENSDFVWSESLPDLVRRSEERASAVSDYLQNEKVRFSTDIEAQQFGQIGKTVAIPALTADLIVLNRSSSLLSGIMASTLEGILFAAGKPVFLLGEPIQSVSIKPEHVMIAWDGSREAANAVHHSLAFLKQARSVYAFSIEEVAKSDLRQSLKSLSRQLTHHAITTQSRLLQADGGTTSQTLIEYVNKCEPDLLVMGAYGHSRLRELIFSGTSRAALDQLKVPILLAH